MTKRIYWANLVICEDQLFESLDALVAVAIESPEAFVGTWHHSNELVSVEITDALEISYTSLDSYDENDKEIRKTEVEKFDFDQRKEMAVLV
tara:strand:- start:7335 stop:7610 length:276 start_codon:yes stop_codon:yes gene_type:complete